MLGDGGVVISWFPTSEQPKRAVTCAAAGHTAYEEHERPESVIFVTVLVFRWLSSHNFSHITWKIINGYQQKVFSHEMSYCLIELGQ